MNKINSSLLGILCILIFLSACSKDESIERKSDLQTTPDTGELVLNGYTILEFANTNYLANNAIKLDQYKNCALLDSISNNEISVAFNSTGQKVDKTPTQWGSKPTVADEFPSIISFHGGAKLSMKLSKKIKEFGFEYNTPFKGDEYLVLATYWDKKLNKKVHGPFGRVLGSTVPGLPHFGYPGGACLYAIKSDLPFDYVEITIEDGTGSFDVYVGGFRYKLSEEN